MLISWDAAKSWQRAGLTALVLSLAALAYLPSLGHLPRADQWGYLLNVIDQDRFDHILLGSYSYNRTLAGGDTDLFRPLLFALLAAEKAAFGNHFDFVQGTGVALHLLVVFLLLRVLFHVAGLEQPAPGSSRQVSARADWLAFAIAAFFAANFAVQELVIWSHINGYLLFLVFLLGSLLLLIKFVRHADAGKWQKRRLLWGAWLLALLSAFTYELGQFFAVVAGLFLAAALHRMGRGRSSLAVFLAFAAVLPLYQSANYLDKCIHRGAFQDENLFPIICERIFSAGTLANSTRFALYTIVQPFFPSAVSIDTSTRLVIPEPSWICAPGWTSDPWRMVSAITLALLLLLAAAGFCRQAAGQKKITPLVVLLAFALFCTYLLMTVLGRMNLRPGPTTLSSNSYYAYMSLLFLLIGAFAALQGIDSTGTGKRWFLSRGSFAVTAMGLVLLSTASGLKVYEVNKEYRSKCWNVRRAINQLDRFVNAHKAEHDFSFTIVADNSANRKPIDFPAAGPEWSPRPPLGEYCGVPLTTILFKRYLNDVNPKYIVAMQHGRVVKCEALAARK